MSTMRERIVSLNDQLVQPQLQRTQVLLQEEDREMRSRPHARLERDRRGWFIRRGRCRRYLRDCRVTYFDSVPTLFQFRLSPDMVREGGLI